jgi:hypothetical protein
MKEMDRGAFMKLAGASSVAAAVPMAGKLAAPDSRRHLQFKAVGGLPEAPLPSYATHLIEGTVDLSSGTGVVTARVLAGHPGGTSGVGLPGLARIIRIEKVEAEGDNYRLVGIIEDRSQLRRGERADVELVVDRKRGVVRAPFLGREATLPLA